MPRPRTFELKATQEQFQAIAQILRMRPGGASYEAAKLMIVDGRSAQEVTRQLNLPHSVAHGILSRVKKGVELTQVASGIEILKKGDF